MTDVEKQELIDNIGATVTTLTGYLNDANTENILLKFGYDITDINGGVLTRSGNLKALRLETIQELKTLTVTPPIPE